MYVVKEHFERYETVDTLAEGGTSTVHLARDHLRDRLVAIKTVNLQGVSDPAERQRLRNALSSEAQVVQLLSHPNIVTVHDLVCTDDQQPPSLVMEYVQGTSLANFLKGGSPLPLDFVTSIITQVADALEHAHAMGVIHGDIKPANILILDDGETAKIVDFGVARLLQGNQSLDNRLYGTPRYIAPELLQGKDPDQRSDLFSLGVVLYEMLTGDSPFDGQTAEELAQEIVGGAANLSDDVLRQVPEALRPVLRQAIHRDPDKRWQSAREFAQSLILECPPRDASTDVVATQDLSALVIPEIADIEPDPESALDHEASDHAEAEREPFSQASVARPQLPSARLALLAVAAAALTLLAGLLGLSLLSPDGPIDARPTADHQLRLTVFPLLQESRRQLLVGEPEVATRILNRARGLALGNSHVAELIASAEQEARQYQSELERAAELESLISQSREALDGGNSPRARRLATQALSMDAENIQALALIDAAQARKVRAPAQISPEPEIEVVATPTATRAVTPPRETAPRPRPIGAPPSPRAREATRSGSPAPIAATTDLRVDVFSYLSKGVLTVYAGKNQVLLEPFRFVQKSGFMRKKKTAGRLEKSLTLPTGPTEFRIYVSAEGQETQSVNLDAKLSGGRTHVLRLIIAENGSASAQLN